MPSRAAASVPTEQEINRASDASDSERPELTPERLYNRYRMKIERQVRFLLGSDAEREDVVQEVLLVLLGGVGRVRDIACLDSWVAQVTVNTVRSEFRRRRRYACWDSVTEADLPIFLPNHDARHLALRLLEALGRVRADDRALLLAYWLSPASLQSMAGDAGCSLVTIHRRVRRARARFNRLVLRDEAFSAALGGALTAARRAKQTPRSAA